MIRGKLEAPLWCMTQQEEGLWIQGVNVMVPQRWVFVYASELALDESLSHQHMGAIYHRGRSPSVCTSGSHGGGYDHVNDQELLGAPLRWVFRVCASKLASDESLGHQHMGEGSQIASTSESHRGDLIIQRYDRSGWRVRLFQCSHSLKGAQQVREQDRVVKRGEEATTSPVELSYPKAKYRLERRWTRRSTTVPQRRIYRSGRTYVESSIPCSHGGRALVVKGAEEVENAKANFKYQDRAEGQRPRNFIRPVSRSFSSR
ncbi:hypothetical protein B296_00008625 [Ensete ventricosum]|uniref:Uncharacterized protein n=1 Tax=Ensete ventricosum TaxID=4639 RepID=A0A426ZST0_ENSVE|nr:hypothetical protein B296_00008625 [Ensete ventricosum]